jgi:hypothetical protein
MFEWFVETCNICVVVYSMSLHHFWLDFLNVIQNTIDLKKLCTNCYTFLDKMLNVLRTHPCTFLHLPKSKFFKHACPINLDSFGAHIQQHWVPFFLVVGYFHLQNTMGHKRNVFLCVKPTQNTGSYTGLLIR